MIHFSLLLDRRQLLSTAAANLVAAAAVNVFPAIAAEPLANEAEEFLKLIHYQQKAFAWLEIALPHGPGQAQRGAPHFVTHRLLVAGENSLFGQRLRQIVQRCAAGSHHGDPPSRGGADEPASVQSWQEPGADEG